LLVVTRSVERQDGQREGVVLSSGREGALISSALPRAVSSCERRQRSAMLWLGSVGLPDMLNLVVKLLNGFSAVGGDYGRGSSGKDLYDTTHQLDSLSRPTAPAVRQIGRHGRHERRRQWVSADDGNWQWS